MYSSESLIISLISVGYKVEFKQHVFIRGVDLLDSENYISVASENYLVIYEACLARKTLTLNKIQT